MRPLSAAALLDVWEQARDESPPERAVTVLAAAHPDATRRALALLPIGERDARLLALHEQLVGRTLLAQVDCPRCGERMELSLATPDLFDVAAEVSTGELRVDAEGCVLHLRHPNSEDLAAVAPLGDSDAARDVLAQRCVLRATRHGEEVDPAGLPRSVTTPIAERLSSADPRADLVLSVECPACAARSDVLLDVPTLLWSQVAAQARRLLGEVDALARVYGWGEAEILAMSARRRGAYLERAGA